MNNTNNYLIKNNEWVDFLLENRWEEWVFYPIDLDTSYSLFFDILKQNEIEFILWTKNEYFIEVLFKKEQVSIIQTLFSTFLFNNEFMNGIYFVNNSEIKHINLWLNLECNKWKKKIWDENYVSYFFLWVINGNNVFFEKYPIYIIDMDMEIDKNEFVLLNKETLPIYNRISAQNSLFKILFNNDWYIENNQYLLEKFLEFWYNEQFNNILDTNLYSTLKKTKFSNLFTVNMNDLMVLNDYNDYVEFDEYEIREVFWKNASNILEYFDKDENLLQIKETDYYIHTIYFIYVLNILKENDANIEVLNEKREMFSEKMKIIDSILYPMFSKYINSITSIDDIYNIIDKYLDKLLK